MGEWERRTLAPSVDKLIELRGAMSPAQWAAAVRAQWARVEAERDAIGRSWERTADIEDATEPSRRLGYESHFLVVAIRQLLRVQKAYHRLTGDERLLEARRAFDAAVPHAKEFRDFLEHLDAYMLDGGKLQESGEIAKDPLFMFTIIYKRPSGRIILHFDGRELDLGDAARAALDLAPVVEQVWSDQVSDGLRDWLGPEQLW